MHAFVRLCIRVDGVDLLPVRATVGTRPLKSVVAGVGVRWCVDALLLLDDLLLLLSLVLLNVIAARVRLLSTVGGRYVALLVLIRVA